MTQYQKAVLALLTGVAQQLDAALRNGQNPADIDAADQIKANVTSALRQHAPTVFGAIKAQLTGEVLDTSVEASNDAEYDRGYSDGYDDASSDIY
jgi:hypothetical protein